MLSKNLYSIPMLLADFMIVFGGHSEFTETNKRIATNFFWRGVKRPP